MAGAFQAGRFEERPDARRFPGAWGAIVRHIASIQDAAIAPAAEAARVLGLVAAGQTDQPMDGTPDSDYGRLKEAVNGVGRSLAYLHAA